MPRASFVMLRDELLKREAFDPLLKAKALVRGGGSTTTRSGHTAPWDTDPRPQRRGRPVFWRVKP